jgi:outer membrane protein TolC
MENITTMKDRNINKQAKVSNELGRVDYFQLYQVLFFCLFSISVKAAPRLGYFELAGLTFKHNVKVQLAKIDLDIANHEGKAAQKDLDWTLALASYYQKSVERKNSTLDHDQVKEGQKSWSAGFSTKTLWHFDFETSYQSLTTDSDSLNAISPSYNQGQWSSKITIPLLKGFSNSQRFPYLIKAPIKISRYKNKLVNTFNKEFKAVIKNYLKIYYLGEKSKTKIKSVYYFDKLLEYTKKAKRQGKKSFLDVLELQAKLLRERVLLYKAENETELALGELKRGLGHQKDYLITLESLDLELKDFPEEVTQYIELSGLSIIEEKQREFEEAHIDYKSARNELLPTLDFELEYSSKGLGTTSSQSIKNVKGIDFPSLSAKLNFTWDFGGSATNGNYRSKRGKRSQKKLIQKQTWLKHKGIRMDSEKEIQVKRRETKSKSDQLHRQNQIMAYHEKLFKLGRESVLDFLDSYNEREESKLSWVKARQGLYTALSGPLLEDIKILSKLPISKYLSNK